MSLDSEVFLFPNVHLEPRRSISVHSLMNFSIAPPNQIKIKYRLNKFPPPLVFKNAKSLTNLESSLFFNHFCYGQFHTESTLLHFLSRIKKYPFIFVLHLKLSPRFQNALHQEYRMMLIIATAILCRTIRSKLKYSSSSFSLSSLHFHVVISNFLGEPSWSIKATWKGLLLNLQSRFTKFISSLFTFKVFYFSLHFLVNAVHFLIFINRNILGIKVFRS